MVPPKGVYDQIFIYFQHYSGEIRYSELTDSGWSGGEDAQTVVSSNVKNRTQLAGISSKAGNVWTVRAFLLQVLILQTLRRKANSQKRIRHTYSTLIPQELYKTSFKVTAATATAVGQPAILAASIFEFLTLQKQHSRPVGSQYGMALIWETAPDFVSMSVSKMASSMNTLGTKNPTHGSPGTSSRAATATVAPHAGLENFRTYTCRIRTTNSRCFGKTSTLEKLIPQPIPLVSGIKVRTIFQRNQTPYYLI